MENLEQKLNYDRHPKETENPMQSIHDTIAFHVRDMAADRRDAWVYGIVCGWDDKSYMELQQRYGWTDKAVERNKRLHQKYLQCWIFIQAQK